MNDADRVAASTERSLTYAEAIEAALAQAMAADDRVIILGEDVHTLRLDLLVRFGQQRVRATPISEAAFLGASVGAAMGGLRPVVEIMLVDFIGVAMDALLNHAAKLRTFSGGRWKAPLVVRAACGGGYGDAGQHEQTLWGWLAHIPGLLVVAPSNPSDAAGTMLAAVESDEPVVFLEHKLLSDYWLDYMGSGGRKNVSFDVPDAGTRSNVELPIRPASLGRASVLRSGSDVTLVSVSVGVHRCLEACAELGSHGISAGVIDLRTVTPLDRETLIEEVRKTGRLVVVDEDYEGFGLSGELAAIALEAGLFPRFARVCTSATVPYARKLEDAVLPSTPRIVEAVRRLE